MFYFSKVLLNAVSLPFFEDNHNIARNRFETDSANAMKNSFLVVKKHKEISMNISLAQSQTLEIITRKNNTSNFRKSYWFTASR